MTLTNKRRKAIAAILVAVGLLSVLAGIASATIWRAPDVLTASTPEGKDAAVLVTAPGVLQMGAQSVTISASTAGEGRIVLGFGRQSDVEAWATGVSQRSITGLSTSTVLKSSVTAGEPTAPDPYTSDLWNARAQGSAQVTMPWTNTDDHVLLMATVVGADGLAASTPKLTLSWEQKVTTPWLWPAVGLGVVLVGVGLLLFLKALSAAKRGRVAEESEGTLPTNESISKIESTPAELANVGSSESAFAPAADGSVEPAPSVESAPPVEPVTAVEQVAVVEPDAIVPAAAVVVDDDAVDSNRNELERPEIDLTWSTLATPVSPEVIPAPEPELTPVVTAPPVATADDSTEHTAADQGQVPVSGPLTDAELRGETLLTRKRLRELRALGIDVEALQKQVADGTADSWRQAWGVQSTPDEGDQQ